MREEELDAARYQEAQAAEQQRIKRAQQLRIDQAAAQQAAQQRARRRRPAYLAAAVLASVLASLMFSVGFWVIAARSPYPVQVWPPAIVSSVVGLIGIIVGSVVVRRDEKRRLGWIGVVCSAVALLAGLGTTATIAVLQSYDIAGWGADSKRDVITAEISSEFDALIKVRSSGKAEPICERLLKLSQQRAVGWGDPFARATVHEYRAWCHFTIGIEFSIEGAFEAAERELAAAAFEAQQAESGFRKTKKPRHLKRMKPIISGIAAQRAKVAAASAEATKMKPKPQLRAKPKVSEGNGKFEMVDVVGRGEKAVAKALGAATRCEADSGGRRKCYYHGERIEVIFEGDSASWITARPKGGGSFHPSYVGAAYGPSMGDPTFANSNAIRWENTKGFSSVQMIPSANGDIDYIYWCRKACR